MPNKKSVNMGKGKVTLKQVRMMKELPTSKTLAEAARKAGYKSDPSQAMKSIEGNQSLQGALVEAGLTADSMAKVYNEIIRDGKPMEQLRALELISKIRGDFAPVETVTKSVNFEAHILDAVNNVNKSIDEDENFIEIDPLAKPNEEFESKNEK